MCIVMMFIRALGLAFMMKDYVYLFASSFGPQKHFLTNKTKICSLTSTKVCLPVQRYLVIDVALLLYFLIRHISHFYSEFHSSFSALFIEYNSVPVRNVNVI
jgi:hypothetical protein